MTIAEVSHFLQGLKMRSETEYGEIALDTAISIVEARHQGEWITEPKSALIRCSNCRYNTLFKYNFCPKCGAYMRGAE